MKFKEFVDGFGSIKFKQGNYHGAAFIYRELILKAMLKHEQLHEWEITDQNIDQLMKIIDYAPIINKFFQDENSGTLWGYHFDLTKWDEYKLLIKTLQAANLLGVIRLYLDSFGLVFQFSSKETKERFIDVSGIKKFFIKNNYKTFHIQGVGDENGFIAQFPNTQIRDNFKALLKEGDVIGDNQLSFKIKEDKDLILNQPYCCTTVGYESFLKRKAFVLSLDQMPDCITQLIYDYIDEDFREIKIGCSDAKEDTTLNKETLQTMVHSLPTFTESLPNLDKEIAMKHSATIHQATELYLNSDGQEKEKNKDVLVSVLGKAYNEPELEHNISWKVIIKNILLCLTGVGLFLLLGKIIYAAVKNNQVDMQSETNLMKNKTACTAQSRSAVKRKEKWYFFAEEPKPRIENNKIEMKSPQCRLG